MSKNTSEKVMVNILNREFAAACKPEEKTALLKSAKMLDARLRDLRNQGASSPNFEQLLVVVALNLCNEISRTNGPAQLSLIEDQVKTPIAPIIVEPDLHDNETLSRLINKIDSTLNVKRD